MIRCFKVEKNKWYEVKLINMTTGEFTTYDQDKKVGFPFGKPFVRTVQEMGYKDVKSCLRSLKQRGILGEEVNHEEQLESERIGETKLGVERIKRSGRINTKDFEDIIKNLNKYGIGYTDAQNIIISTYLNLGE